MTTIISLPKNEPTYTPYLMRQDGSSERLRGDLAYSDCLRVALAEMKNRGSEFIGFAIREVRHD